MQNFTTKPFVCFTHETWDWHCNEEVENLVKICISVQLFILAYNEIWKLFYDSWIIFEGWIEKYFMYSCNCVCDWSIMQRHVAWKMSWVGFIWEFFLNNNLSILVERNNIDVMFNLLHLLSVSHHHLPHPMLRSMFR